MIVLIDNYDSFSYNVYQLLGSIYPDIKVIRNDEYTIQEIEEMKPEGIVISPGPKKPKDAGICIEAIQYFYDKLPILGICLGHQSIFEAFGGTVSYAKELMHGKQKDIFIVEKSQLFDGVSNPFKAARYHSLSAVETTCPTCLKVIARSQDDEIMAIEHKEYPVYGVQFHPESIMTLEGNKMIQNFINSIKGGK